MTRSIAGVLKELDAKNVDVLELLRLYGDAAHQTLWQRDARLYRAFVRRLVGAGQAARAFELAREGLTIFPNDLELQYLRALSLARGGNTSKAIEYSNALLQDAKLSPELKSETLSLAGRLAKDRYERARDISPTKRVKMAAASAELYAQALAIEGRSFPCINAATMTLLAGHEEQSRELAAQAIEQAQSERRGKGRSRDAWLLATLGEAHLILGDFETAAKWYRQAAQSATGRRGDLASMRRNIVLLAEKRPVSAAIWQIFDPGNVVAFVGQILASHRVLDAGQSGASYSNKAASDEAATERAIAEAIEDRLKVFEARVGICWPTCGANILFAEAILARGGELHLVLPTEREDFFHTGVDFGEPEMKSWRERCEKLIECATQIHNVTRENFLSDCTLFDFASTVTQGLALNLARESDAGVCILSVLDPAAQSGNSDLTFDPATEFVARWNDVLRVREEQMRAVQTHIIDVADLRAGLEISSGKSAKKTTASKLPGQSAGREPAKKLRVRHVRAMLFADVKNFSHLSEEQTPSFFVSFLGVVSREIEVSAQAPMFANTWGDGLFMVFEDTSSCADFALRLLERIEKTDWTKFDLPSDTTIRMGIHAGPVYATQDKIIGRTNFFGAHVNRAARIEPVTTPGCAFTTDQFASLLAVEAGETFRCEYMGVEDLAKGYDRCVLYRLSRF